jgi:uncharacterized protein (TIGR00369 family)
MADSDYPPAGHFLGDLGLETEAVAPGRAVVRTRVTPAITGSDGGVRAGVLATLVDVVGGVAALRMVDPPDWLATADLTLQVVRPLVGPVVEAKSTVVRKGHTTLVIESEVFDCGEDGSPVVHAGHAGPGAWATMTFAILSGRSPSAVDVPAGLPDRWRVSGPGFDRPIVDALAISVTDRPAGAVAMPVHGYLHNSFGAVQGGVIALLGEVAGAAALGAAGGTGAEPVVSDLRLAYLTLGRVGPMVSRASVLRPPEGVAGGSAVVELVDEGAGDRLTTVIQVGTAPVGP